MAPIQARRENAADLCCVVGDEDKEAARSYVLEPLTLKKVQAPSTSGSGTVVQQLFLDYS
ncbi:hypothetical protein NHJ6243_005845 [Beauveria neobassiana]